MNSVLVGLIEHSVYSRRNLRLFRQIEHIKSTINKGYIEFEDVFVIDLMPLEKL